MGDAEAKLRLEAAIEAVRRDLDIEPEVAEAAPMPVLPDGTTPAARVRELDRELRLLGPINPLALEEFNELQQRHTSSSRSNSKTSARPVEICRG
jgi:chromosome segregation protein